VANRHSSARYLPVKDFPAYEVGDDGSLWSHLIAGHSHLRRLSPVSINGHVRKSDRHVTVTLINGPTKRVDFLHRVVLEAFVGPCPKGMEGCHGDGDPTNNQLNNLRWDTHKANGQDMVRHGSQPRGQAHYNSKLTEEDVHEIRQMLRLGRRQKDIAKQFQIDQSTVANIKSGKSWSWLI
jgi:hypothetical protein